MHALVKLIANPLFSDPFTKQDAKIITQNKEWYVQHHIFDKEKLLKNRFF